MCRILVLLLCCAAGALARGATFEEANQLYDEGKFAEAKAAYDGLVSTKNWNANLFYNLGCTEHRLGARGEAVLEFQRALMLEPSHPEARANLTFLRDQGGAIVWPGSWIDRLLPEPWANVCAVIGALAGWAAVFLIARALLSSPGDRPGWWTGVIAALLVTGYSAALIWHAEKGADRAIVTAKAAEARLAPAASAGSAAVLPAGSEVRVLNERGEWIYCALPRGGRGWVAAKEVARVRLRAS
jgi:tetratricopeptide (TPR) repeat protein